MNKFIFFLFLFVSPVILFAADSEDGYECDSEQSSECEKIAQEIENLVGGEDINSNLGNENIQYEYVDLDDELAKQMANHLFKYQGIDEQLDTLINDYCGLKTIFRKLFGKKNKNHKEE